MKRVKIGDIVEVQTAKGLTYAQYTHKDKVYGALIRVFDETYGERPRSFEHVVAGKVRFSVFFPLGPAVSRGIFEVVGNEPLRPDLQEFPLFRAGNRGLPGTQVAVWWLYDGEKEWKIGELSEEQRKLPILGICNDTFLISRIESGWTPETDPF